MSPHPDNSRALTRCEIVGAAIEGVATLGSLAFLVWLALAL